MTITTPERVRLKTAAAAVAAASIEDGMIVGLGSGSTASLAVGSLHLLKGRGGALLREKIIVSATERLMIVVDEAKLVERLGVHGPVAVEVVPFAWRATARKLQSLGADVARRATGEGQPFITDGGHYILDCAFGAIDDPEQLQRQLDRVVGVVEHGLFLGLAPRVIVGGERGVQVLQSTRSG